MSEALRKAMTMQQWAITKGHINATLALVSARRITDSPTSHEEDDDCIEKWLRFRKAADEFIALVEDEGWVD